MINVWALYSHSSDNTAPVSAADFDTVDYYRSFPTGKISALDADGMPYMVHECWVSDSFASELANDLSTVTGPSAVLLPVNEEEVSNG